MERQRLIDRGLALIEKYRARIGPSAQTYYLGTQIDGPGWTTDEQIRAIEAAIKKSEAEKQLREQAISELFPDSSPNPNVIECESMEELADRIKKTGEKIIAVRIGYQKGSEEEKREIHIRARIEEIRKRRSSDE